MRSYEVEDNRGLDERRIGTPNSVGSTLWERFQFLRVCDHDFYLNYCKLVTLCDYWLTFRDTESLRGRYADFKEFAIAHGEGKWFEGSELRGYLGHIFGLVAENPHDEEGPSPLNNVSNSQIIALLAIDFLKNHPELCDQVKFDFDEAYNEDFFNLIKKPFTVDPK